MTTWAHWRGLIARLDIDTTDGRRLVVDGDALGHFVRLPVPVTARPKLSETVRDASPPEVIGRIDQLSVRTPRVLNQHGRELHASGVINLNDLFIVREDLVGTTFTQSDDGQSQHEAWPVGIRVDGGDFTTTPEGVIVVSGAWELAGMEIEHLPAVWAGVGIQLTDFEDDGWVKS